MFNNLAGATFIVQSDPLLGTTSSEFGSALVFNNAGLFRKSGGTGAMIGEYLVFTNSGTVEVQTGTLSLFRCWQASTSGTLAVSAGASVEFERTSAFFVAGSTVSGAGTVRALEGSIDISGTYNLTGSSRTELISSGATFMTSATTSTLYMAGSAFVAGPGNVTVTNRFDWVKGTLEGSGKFIIAPGAIAHLNGDQEKTLAGRPVAINGQVTWAGTGSVRRPSGDVFTNLGVIAAPGLIPFDAVVGVGTLYRAMYGGLTGWGTTEDAVYSVLEGRTIAELNQLREIYNRHYGRHLDDDLAEEFSGDEWIRVQALIANPINRPRADAAALRYAMFGGLTGLSGIGVDHDTIFRVLENGNIAAITSAYQQLYGESPHRDDALLADLQSQLSTTQMDRAEALLDGNRTRADAARLREGILNVELQTISLVLRGRTADELADLANAYQWLYAGVPPRPDALLTDVRAAFSGAELTSAEALLGGDPIRADAARLFIAMDGLGTDEEAVWQTLDQTNSLH